MKTQLPKWLEPAPWRKEGDRADAANVRAALAAESPGLREMEALLSPAAEPFLEVLARRAQALTRRHFGRTVSLYVPLYLSNYCSGGCLYCGFASDRRQVRRRLETAELRAEIRALKRKGFEDVLLLTGERTPKADFDYLLESVRQASEVFHNVAVEAFAMTEREYGLLAAAGCTGITLYQETYDPKLYARLHRWGEKRDFLHRLEAPERALAAGVRTAGVGVLLGLADPREDGLRLARHVRHLQTMFWKGGVQVSFPRICPQAGGYRPAHPVGDRFLAQMIYAFRICFPDVPLVLSTRERPAFRDGMAGVGISRMSVASRTTVGGYHHGPAAGAVGQFEVSDRRTIRQFCVALKKKGLEPVFKNWESVFR